LAKAQTGVIDRKDFRKPHAEAVVFQQSRRLFGERAVLEDAREPNPVDAVLFPGAPLYADAPPGGMKQARSLPGARPLRAAAAPIDPQSAASPTADSGGGAAT
jgi:hypothetical protein